MQEQFISQDNKIGSIDDQLKNPKHIKIEEEELDVYDISPEKTKTEIPVVFSLGYSTTPEIYAENIRVLAESGRRVISVDSPHGLKVHTVPEELSGILPEVELPKLSAVVESLNELGIDKVDVVGHSEGGSYMALAAYLYPKKFRNLVLVDPAGMIGKDNIFDLVKRNAENKRRRDNMKIQEPTMIDCRNICKVSYQRLRFVIKCFPFTRFGKSAFGSRHYRDA